MSRRRQRDIAYNRRTDEVVVGAKGVTFCWNATPAPWTGGVNSMLAVISFLFW